MVALEQVHLAAGGCLCDLLGQVTVRAGQLYSQGHPLIARNLEGLQRSVEALSNVTPAIVIGVVGDEVIVNDLPVPAGGTLIPLVHRLRRIGIERVSIDRPAKNPGRLRPTSGGQSVMAPWYTPNSRLTDTMSLVTSDTLVPSIATSSCSFSVRTSDVRVTTSAPPSSAISWAASINRVSCATR